MAAFDRCLSAARIEAGRAEMQYGDFTSTHEALGVLVEEWDELRAAIHDNAAAAIRDEAIQVAAVALRLAALCDVDDDNAARRFRERSGLV